LTGTRPCSMTCLTGMMRSDVMNRDVIGRDVIERDVLMRAL
jgi:hypothetical protein